jgi:queuosine precursor transporter
VVNPFSAPSTEAMKNLDTSAVEPAHRRSYRYLDLISVGFVTVLLCSNLIGPGKTCQVFGLDFGAGNLFFPIGYIFGDILTEVYGYAKTRRVIWAGFAALIFAAFMSFAVVNLPASPDEPFNKVIQPAVEVVFGSTWRIVLASLLGFWAGDFVNAFVLARMKVLTNGKHLWTRTIGSTLAGQTVDSLVFYPLAFAGVWTSSTMLAALLFNICFKVAVEVVFTPVTYLIVNFLKRAEQEDHYDVDTNFSPFASR